MAWVRALRVNAVYVSRQTSMKIPSIFRSAYSMADEKVLIDSGATANFLDRRVAKQLGFKPKKLERPVPVKNINGTPNKDGQLTHCIHLWVQLGEKKELMLFVMTVHLEHYFSFTYPFLSPIYCTTDSLPSLLVTILSWTYLLTPR